MSEQAKFTPGPWEWITTTGDRGRVKGKPIRQGLWNKTSRKGVLAPDYTEINGEGVWESWIQVSDENARLIAAAPELLSTLQAASAQLDSACRDFAALVETSEACMSTNALRARQGSLLAKLAAVNCERAAQKAQAVISKATGTSEWE